MHVEDAWLRWWENLGHVARLNRDKARIREAFEAGFLAAREAESGMEAEQGSRQAVPDTE
ncbi:hypothetical protein D3C87_2204030 [compost metagenome]